MSEATIRAYRDTWRLLLTFLSQAVHVPAHQLQLTHLDPAHVVAFLDYLEHERGNSATTRNLRLAAIKSVMAFHANRAPERLDTIARINAIPVKKHPKPQMTFLTCAEAQALLDAVPTSTWTNRRDRTMLTLAIQTGLRLSEITSLQIASLHLGAAAHVACTGKGRKNRTTPLTSTTTTALKAYLHERITRPGQALFPGPHGHALSADAVQQRLALHVTRAAASCPGLASKHVTVHTLRHTAVISPGLNLVRDVGHGGGRARASRVSGTRLCRWLPSPRDRVDQRRVPGRAGGVAARRRRVVGGARR